MKRYLLFFAFLAISITSYCQVINQLGYYYKNGIMALDSKDHLMILGNGEIVDNSNPASPVLVSQYFFL